MPISRQELQLRLARLESDMPELTSRYPDFQDFIGEFAGHADYIMDNARNADHAWAYSEIDRILHNFGIIERDARSAK